LPDEPKRPVEIARRERVTQLKNDTAARDRDKSADILEGDLPFLLAQEKVELLELVLDRASVATGQQDEQIECSFVKTQAALPG
jgi:hypothetical protein